VLVLLPFLVPVVVNGVANAWPGNNAIRWGKKALFAGIALLFLARNAGNIRDSFRPDSEHVLPEDTYAFLRDAPPVGASVLSAEAQTLFLHTGRSAVRFFASTGVDEFVQTLRNENIHLVLLQKSHAPSNPAAFQLRVAEQIESCVRSDPRFHPIYENAREDRVVYVLN
jgi:hypothetical protein